MKPEVPFGIISIKHEWPKSLNYSELNFNLVIEYEPKIKSAYFWAKQFWFENGDGGYLGIQSEGDINGTRQKIAIFSIWKAIGAESSPIMGSSSKPFDHEGSGYSCKIPFDWNQGKEYNLRIVKSDMDEHQNHYWDAFVIDILSGNEFLIGRILIPKPWGYLKHVQIFL